MKYRILSEKQYQFTIIYIILWKYNFARLTFSVNNKNKYDMLLVKAHDTLFPE